MERSKNESKLHSQDLLTQENLGSQPVTLCTELTLNNRWQHTMKHLRETLMETSTEHFIEPSRVKVETGRRLTDKPLVYVGYQDFPPHLRCNLITEAPYNHYAPMASVSSGTHGTANFSAVEPQVLYKLLVEDELAFKIPDADYEYGAFNQQLHDLQEEVFSGEFAQKHQREQNNDPKPSFREWPKGKRTEPYEL